MVIGRPNVFEETRAQVAQLVEQWTENPRVGGSNPPLGTTCPRKKASFSPVPRELIIGPNVPNMPGFCQSL